HGLAQPAALGHRARAPMRRVGGSALQGQPYHPFNLRVPHFARRPGPRFIKQSIKPPLHKPLAPFADSLLGDPKLVGHHCVGIPIRACQNDPCALGKRLRRLGPACPLFQTLPLFPRYHQWSYRSSRPHPPLPPTRRTETAAIYSTDLRLRTLVSRFRNKFSVFDAAVNLFGGLGPDEGC